MSFIADGHIHIYPSFDLNKLILKAHQGLKSISHADSYVLFTVEPSGQLEFNNIVKRVSADISISPTDDKSVLKLNTPFGNDLYLIAGRQVVSKEKLEFLILFYNRDVPNGLTIEELVEASKNTGSILVLNWAPGKWMFERAQLVKDILERYTPEDLIICDTALRFVPEPALMKKARSKGFKIIAGTDPFPLGNEEERVGDYGFFADGNNSFRESLRKCDLQIVGKRLSAIEALRRLWKWSGEKRKFKI